MRNLREGSSEALMDSDEDVAAVEVAAAGEEEEVQIISEADLTWDSEDEGDLGEAAEDLEAQVWCDLISSMQCIGLLRKQLKQYLL